jgi:arsenate reductase
MAEGFARQVANGTRIYSAGTAPEGIHPFAARVMKEAGVDISKQQSKGLDSIPLDQVDLLITLCGEEAQPCSVLSGKVERVHWPLVDPALAQGDDEQVLRVFRQVRDDIRARIQELFSIPHV